MGKKDRKSRKCYTLIGGQALIEGVMMRGKTSMAMAVRNSDGDILLETERIKPKKKIARLIIIRGIVAFINSLVMGVSLITRSAEVGSGEDEQLGKFGTFIAVFLGIALALVFFFFLPGLIAGFFNDYVFDNALVKNLVSGVLRIAIFVGYLALISLMNDINRTFMYHGAEHRTINCFEAGLPLTVENVQSCSKRHNRCGTTFMFLVMVISIIVFAFVEVGLNEFIKMDKGIVRTLTFMGIKFLFLPLVAGLSYEVLFLFAKLPDSIFTTILRAPGLALQYLTTKVPDDKMVEVAIASFNAVLILEADPNAKTQKFTEIPIENARKILDEALLPLGAEPAEADWLLCEATLKSRSELDELKFISLDEYKRLKTLLNKRKTMPLDYCLGKSCFFGRDIAVDKRVLIPRMETEILTEAAIKAVKEKAGADNGEKSVRVLDLCTGSGCIALTIAKETAAEVTAVDISEDALEVAEKNLFTTTVKYVKSDLFSALNGQRFDVIVSNPPYIKTADIAGLQPEVQCQPVLALDGGADGLDFYRRIAADAPEYLEDAGRILLEVGYDQAAEVSGILRSNGFKSIEILKDLEGLDRIVVAQVK